jgi:hypothetical protein
VNGDTAFEGDETFTLAVSSASYGDATATGTIQNDDAFLDVGDSPVTEFALGPITPNPTRDARIDFAVARESRITLDVIDLAGRDVARLADGTYRPGRYRVAWNGRSRSVTLGTGIYFVRYQGGGKTFVRRLVLIP